MNDLPDAPWVRDAELNGYPSDDPVHCPICGEECDTIFYDKNGEIFGCEQCIQKKDAYEWAEEERLAQQEGADDW